MPQSDSPSPENARPQIKVCGLTRLSQALACAELGADAIGLVFYPPSPRHLDLQTAQRLCRGLPKRTRTVGVFVDETYSTIMQKVEACGLSGVQLHGRETPELVDCLKRRQLIVIKGLYIDKAPLIGEAAAYNASAFLIESGHGKLPGGNALAWDWQSSQAFGRRYPLVLAGGLSPDNVAQAIHSSQPDAVDVSSGVEKSPGDKDIDKIRLFIETVRGAAALPCGPSPKHYRRIF